MEKEMKWIKNSGIVSLVLFILYISFNQDLFFSMLLLALLVFVGSIAYALILHFKRLVKTKRKRR